MCGLKWYLLFTLSAEETLSDASQDVLCNIDVHCESLAEARLLVNYMASADEEGPENKLLYVIIM